jgi:hypothetical protein
MNWVRDPRPGGYSSNGSDERDRAEGYYERVGYPGSVVVSEDQC